MGTVVDNCATAAKSTDARDKYFLSYVGEFDPFPAKALQSELPSLEAAKASLTTTISDLVDALPRLASCQAHGSLASSNMNQQIALTGLPSLTKNSSILLRTQTGADNTFAKTTAAVDALMAEARSTILAAHKALQ